MGEHLLDDGGDVRVVDMVELAAAVAAGRDDSGGAQPGRP